MKTLKVCNLKEPLDINLQLVATEMDTSAKFLRCLTDECFTDAIELDAFKNLVNDIKVNDGVEVTSFDDNTTLWEYNNEAIVLHETLGKFYVIYDVGLESMIRSKFNSFM